jgi:hypothetical protein
MLQNYSSTVHLKTFDIINKYNIVKKEDIFYIDKILFEVFLKKDSSDMRFSYKIYFIFYLLFNTFSFVNYKLIPGTNRNVSFSVKLEGSISNKVHIEAFIRQFLLEKTPLLNFKTITQSILSKNDYIFLSLSVPLKEYIEFNSSKIPTLSLLNIESEMLLLKFRLSKKNIINFFLDNSLLKHSHYFSFWKILIKQK